MSDDPFEARYWDASKLLAWVRWRKPEVIRKYWPKDITIFAPDPHRIRPNDSPDCDDELTEVMRALQQGALTATRDGFRLPRHIWERFSLRYESVEMFNREEILRLWPPLDPAGRRSAARRSPVRPSPVETRRFVARYIHDERREDREPTALGLYAAAEAANFKATRAQLGEALRIEVPAVKGRPKKSLRKVAK
jgi:hypothetical protein